MAARDEGGDTNSYLVFYNQGILSLAQAGTAFSVQAVLEAIALLLIFANPFLSALGVG